MCLSVLRSTMLVSVVAVALAACGEQAAVPLQPGSVGNLALSRSAQPVLLHSAPFGIVTRRIVDQSLPDKKSEKKPCNVKGIWYFHGSCVQANLDNGAGSTISLAAYKGIGMRDATGPITTTGKATLVVGEGTGSGDITGKLNGTVFPLMTNNCVTGSGTATACPKAMLYFDNFNSGKSTIAFSKTPAVALTSKAGKNSKCTLGILVTVQSTKFRWWQTPVQGTFKNGTLSLLAASWGGPQGMPPNYFATYAVGCSK